MIGGSRAPSAAVPRAANAPDAAPDDDDWTNDADAVADAHSIGNDSDAAAVAAVNTPVGTEADAAGADADTEAKTQDCGDRCCGGATWKSCRPTRTWESVGSEVIGFAGELLGIGGVW